MQSWEKSNIGLTRGIGIAIAALKSIHTSEYRRFLTRLKSARRDAGVTQTQLAEKLGRQQSYVAKIERAERRLDIVEFIQIMRILRMSPLLVLGDLVDQPAQVRPKPTLKHSRP